MRYTTIIDIREYPGLYKNAATRLVYLHLVLASGYHDHDRDLVNTSLRRIARDAGVTIGAARHALEILTKYQLLKKEGPLYKVRKFLVEAPITPRAKSQKALKAAEIRAQEAVERDLRQQERARQDAERKALRNQGKTSFMLWYEEEMLKAAQGDPAAIDNVRTNEATYKMHAAEVAKEAKS